MISIDVKIYPTSCDFNRYNLILLYSDGVSMPVPLKAASDKIKAEAAYFFRKTSAEGAAYLNSYDYRANAFGKNTMWNHYVAYTGAESLNADQIWSSLMVLMGGIGDLDIDGVLNVHYNEHLVKSLKSSKGKKLEKTDDEDPYDFLIWFVQELR